MNLEQQRIAIAEACGWTQINTIGDKLCGIPKKGIPQEVITALGNKAKQELPNYPQDLNAMHEAENQCINTPELEETYYFAIKRNFRATAAERAEAFLKVLGKWLE